MNVLPCQREWYAAHFPPPVPKAKPAKMPKVRTPATPDELRAIAAISPAKVTYGPGTATKRFARDIQAAKELTDAQREYLWSTVWRFRRQVKDEQLIQLAKSKV